PLAIGPAKNAITSNGAKTVQMRERVMSCVRIRLETDTAAMFPIRLITGFSLMPASQLAQNQVRILARLVDIVEDGRAAHFAGVVDHHVAKSKDSLRDRSRNRDILNLAQGDVTRGARDQPVINLDFGVSQRIPDHVPFQVVIGGNKQDGQRERQPNKPGNIDELDQVKT